MDPIPQDIVKTIIDLVATTDILKLEDRQAALRACAPVSTSFLFLVRRHRFRTVVIRVGGHEAELSQAEKTRLRLLSSIIADDPFAQTFRSVVSQIRELKIEFTLDEMDDDEVDDDAAMDTSSFDDYYMYREDDEDEDDDDDDDDDDDEDEDEDDEDDHLRGIIKMFSSVQEVACTFDESPDYWCWTEMDDAFSTAIAELCRLPTVTSLRFEYVCEFPAEIITNCPNLKHLTLRNVETADGRTAEPEFPYEEGLEDIPPHLNPPRVNDEGLSTVRLESLDVSSSNSLLESLLGSSSSVFSRLRSLKGHMSGIREALLNWHVMLMAAASLETLELEDVLPMNYTDMYHYTIDLGKCRNLKHLSLSGSLSGINKLERLPLGIWGLVEGITIPSTTESIELQLKLTTLFQGAENSVFSPWATFDAALMSPNLPNLRTVDVGFAIHYNWTEDAAGNNQTNEAAAVNIRQRLQSVLPLTLSTKLLNIAVNVEGHAVQGVFTPESSP
ncbi:hypothetical protein BDZ97DRAFT_685195 [Flammula alnicola]|nr:hypothetical protein BDZ97DRAFT_685195 [Flammula alnicola]